MGKTLLKISVVYLLLGISFTLYESVTDVVTLSAVHDYINLLGWVSLALIGVFYHLYPNLEKNGLAQAHFWFHNIGLLVMLLAITLEILEFGDVFLQIATVGCAAVLIGVFSFGYNVLRNLDKG